MSTGLFTESQNDFVGGVGTKLNDEVGPGGLEGPSVEGCVRVADEETSN